MNEASLQGLTLHVADVERSLEFYKKIPGAQVQVHRPGDFALIQFGNSRLGLLRHDVGQFHIELETDDLDALHKNLVAAGIDAKPPSAKPWGEVDFLVMDPDGYMIEFGGHEHADSSPQANWQHQAK